MLNITGCSLPCKSKSHSFSLVLKIVLWLEQAGEHRQYRIKDNPVTSSGKNGMRYEHLGQFEEEKKTIHLEYFQDQFQLKGYGGYYSGESVSYACKNLELGGSLPVPVLFGRVWRRSWTFHRVLLHVLCWSCWLGCQGLCERGQFSQMRRTNTYKR